MAGCINPAIHVFRVAEKQFLTNVMERLTGNRSMVCVAVGLRDGGS
jgi:hypothetical protein